MKKLLTIAVLLIGMITTAQDYGQKWGQRDKAWYPFATIGFDARNCIDGSKPTGGRAELDFQVKLGARANHVEVSAMYERFQAIDFQYYGANVNYVFEIAKNTDVAMGIETGSIIRGTDNFLTAGLNAELRYEVPRTPFIFGLQGNYRARPEYWKKGTDLPTTKSVWVNFTYKFN